MYTIEKDGDYWEKKFHPRLFPMFPNYDEFWRLAIIPLTDRAHTGGIDLRSNIDRNLKLLAMSHYACYYHLGVAGEHLDASLDFPHAFDDLLLHLITSVEMVTRRFITICEKIWDETGLIETRQAFYNSLGVSWQANLKTFEEIGNEISQYRNAIAHNPKLAQVYADKSTQVWIPKYVTLVENENMTGSDLAALLPDCPEHFVERDRLALRLMTELPGSINSLWPEVISMFQYLSRLESYQRLMGLK
ncbi:MAG TPA: hypothetical protein VJ508_09770 [Saprospiraceae bacterium]|nr:hypothetical protein [Saprospiraceae bacterium]